MLKSGQPFIYAVYHDNTVTIISQSSFYRLKKVRPMCPHVEGLKDTPVISEVLKMYPFVFGTVHTFSKMTSIAINES